MKLKCAQHGEEEGESRPIYLCHHCGKAVCREHGTMLVPDEDFDPSNEPLTSSAMHCPECIRYHRWDGRRAGAGAAVSS